MECIRKVPSWTRLTPFPGDFYWCRCSWGQLEEWGSCPSISGISKGETCLEGLLEGVWGCSSLCVGSLCGRLWHCSCCTPLLCECLCVGQEQHIDEPSCGCLTLVASAQAGGMTTMEDAHECWGNLSLLLLLSCLDGEQAGFSLQLLGEHGGTPGSAQPVDWAQMGCAVLHPCYCGAVVPSCLLVSGDCDWAWDDEGVHGGAWECTLPVDWDLPEHVVLWKSALTSIQSSSL